MTTTISMLAIDLAKGSFQVCAIGLDGAVLYNPLLSRTRLTNLLAEHSACVVAMEACATSHYWGRAARFHGHEVRLVPAVYVKPFVKRQKNDKADAEVIAEARVLARLRHGLMTPAFASQFAAEVERLMKQVPEDGTADMARIERELKKAEAAIERLLDRLEGEKTGDALLARLKAREAERAALRQELAGIAARTTVIRPGIP